MQALKGLRAQEQPDNIEPTPLAPRAARRHEAAETHPRRFGDDVLVAGVVAGLDEGGEGLAAGLRVGDQIYAVDGSPLRDVLEFAFLTSGEPARLSVRREGVDLEVDLPGEGPTGIHFERELFDGLRKCENSCVFCFVHQLPRRGLRRSLLMKDEDYRLSFLHGGYMTLGNLKEDDWERILDMRLSPLYISVQATDLAVRRKMLGNERTPDVLPALRRLEEGGIDFYGQVVLVPGWNDGEVLERTLADLAGFSNMLSTAVVPVGLTRFREHLPDIRGLTAAEARAAVATIDQARERDPRGARAYAADELYQQAGLPLPSPAYYGEGYPLREDGVGMLTSFQEGLERVAARAWARPGGRERAARLGGRAPRARVAIVTGTAAAPHFRRTLGPLLAARAPEIDLEVLEVENEFFGPGITVAGLLTGPDILAAVRAAGPFDRVLIGEHTFQPGSDLLLDGLELADLRRELPGEVRKVADDPGALVEAILGRELGLAGGSCAGAPLAEPGLFAAADDHDIHEGFQV